MPHSPSRPAPYAGVANSDYEPPVPITPPPIYAWPPRPLAVVRWFVGRLLYPWVGTYLVLSLIIWKWLLPPEDQMATLQANWILQIWVRNLAVLTRWPAAFTGRCTSVAARATPTNSIDDGRYRVVSIWSATR